MTDSPLITNDAVVLGMLLVILALVFSTAASPRPFWKKFYGIVPSVLLCYFLPSLLSTFGIVSGEDSSLYFVASRYLLPTALPRARSSRTCNRRGMGRSAFAGIFQGRERRIIRAAGGDRRCWITAGGLPILRPGGI